MKWTGRCLLVSVAVLFQASFQAARSAMITVGPAGGGYDHETIQDAMTAATAGDTISVAAGTYVQTGTVAISKQDITIQGAASLASVVHVSLTAVPSYAFSITASGVTMVGLKIEKTDKAGPQNLIYLGAHNATVRDCEISGQFVMGDSDVSRAFEVAYGITNLTIQGNSIHGLRQPGYFNGSLAAPTTGTVADNYVYGTKGWVVAGANLTFTGNTWGAGVDANYLDIVLLSGTPIGYYPDIVALSAANSDAAVQDQRVAAANLSDVFVNATAVAGGDGTITKPCQTISDGIAKVLAGGTVHVATGAYHEQVTISKALTLAGSDGAVVDGTGLTATWTTGIKIKCGNVTVDNIDVSNFTQDGITAYKNINMPNLRIKNCRISNIQPGNWGFGIYIGYESEGFVYTPPHLTTHLDFSGLLIESNEIVNTHSSALVLQAITGTLGTLQVRGNYIHDNISNSGIWIDCARNLLIENNTITNNKWGIEMSAIPEAYSIPSYTPNTPNRLDGPYSPKDITIQGNLISGNTFEGVVLYEARPGTISLTGNRIHDNGTGVENQLAAEMVADGNYWGDATGPSGTGIGSGEEIAGSVAYNSWYADAALTQLRTIRRVPADYGTIQAAIDAAVDDDIVQIAAGSYVENVIVSKRVRILGAGADALGTILMPASGRALTIAASGTSSAEPLLITGLRIDLQSPGTAIELNHGINHVRVEDCWIHGGSVGVRAGTGADISHLVFRGLTFSGNVQDVYLATRSSPPGIADDILFENCSFSGSQKGIYVEKFSNATIRDCTFNGVGGDSAYAWGAAIDLNLKYGVFSNILIEGCTFTDCAIGSKEGMAIGIKARGTGTDSGYASSPATLAGVTITGCTITGSERGIRLGEPGKTGMTGPTDVTITGNLIYGNTLRYAGETSLGGDLINLTAIPVAASANYWGSDAPVFAEQVRGPVGLSSYYADATLTQLLYFEIFVDDDFDANTLGWGSTHFASMQGGVDAAGGGGTVHVASGTYIENVMVGRPLILSGPNAGKAGDDPTRGPEAILLPATSDPNPYSPGAVILLYIAASDVTVRGLTLDGDNPALTSGKLVGTNDVDACEGLVSYEGVGRLTIEDNVVRNTAYSGMDFYNWSNGGGATTGSAIRRNLIDNVGHIPYGFGQGLIVYNNFYAEVSDNTLTNVRVGIQTGNFSQADPGHSRAIIGNRIASSRRGIFHNLAYGTASSFNISDNEISVLPEAGLARWDGIMLSSLQGSVSVTLAGNRIIATDVPQLTVGIQVWNDPTAGDLLMDGGAVGGADYGVWINDYDGYGPSAGDSARLTLHGVAVSNASLAGVYVKDNAANPNPVNLSAVLSGGTRITDCAIGVLLEGAGATVSFTGAAPAEFEDDAQYISLASNGSTVPAGNVDARAVLFDGKLGSAMTTAEGFAVEAKVTHKLDDPALGLVTWIPGIFYVQPGASLATAIALASPGDTIRLAAGTHALVSALVIDKALNLVGDGATIDGDVVFAADPITLSGITVDGDATVPAGARLVSGHLIVPVGASMTVTEGSLTVDGAEIYGSFTLTDSPGTLTILDDFLADGGTVIWDHSHVVLDGGARILAIAATNGATFSIVHGTEIEKATGSSNFLFRVADGCTFTMTDSALSGCGVSGTGDEAGLYVDTSLATIERVTLTGNHIGLVWGPYGIGGAIHDSLLAGNELYAAYNNAVTINDASFNWWGDVSGPNHPAANPHGLGSPVGDRILFAPWYTSATLAETAAATAFHSTEGFRSPGTMTVACELHYPAGQELASLLWIPILPSGWTLAAVEGDGEPEIGTNLGQPVLEFLASHLTANPLRFSYTVNVPVGEPATRQIEALVEYALDGMVNPDLIPASPDPLTFTRRHALTIASLYGLPEPAVGTYTNRYGSILTNSVTALDTRGTTQFVAQGWSMPDNDMVSGVTPAMTMTLTNDTTLTWLWSTNYQLSVAAGPNGSVTGDASGWYANGDSVSVTAVPDAHYHFAGWSGDVQGDTNDPTMNLTMDRPRAVTANFAIDRHTLLVVSDHGASSPSAGEHTYDYGTVVAMNLASPVAGPAGVQYVGTGWTLTDHAPASGAGTAWSFALATDATFTWLWKTQFQFAATAQAGGTVAAVPGWYDDGSTVPATATAMSGFVFDGWTGDVPSGSELQSALTLTIDQPRTVTATFAVDETRIAGAQTCAGVRSPSTSNSVECSFAYPADQTLDVLAWSPILPAGWTLVAASGDGAPVIIGTSVVFNATLLTNNPVTFSYHFAAPGNVAVSNEIGALALFRFTGMPDARTTEMTPGRLAVYRLHSADYRAPTWVMDATELNRVLAYWRMGGYAPNVLGFDGYAATRTPGTDPTPGLHSADYQAPVWQIDAAEAARVIAYWRDGGLHVDAAGADGYASGAPSLLALRPSGTSPKAAQPALSLIQTLPPTYEAGGAVTVNCVLAYSGRLLALSWKPVLPEGWTIMSVSGTGRPELVRGEVLWTSSSELPSPLAFAYVVQAPLATLGAVTLGGVAQPMLQGLANAATVSATSSAAMQVADADSDGIADGWERAYAASGSLDPLADADGDGMHNLAEYLANTVPTDPHSLLVIEAVQQVEDGVIVRWQSANGRRYRVLGAIALDGAFIPMAAGLASTPPANAAEFDVAEAVRFLRVEVDF